MKSEVNYVLNPKYRSRLLATTTLVLLAVLCLCGSAAAINTRPINYVISPLGGPLPTGQFTITCHYLDEDGYATITRAYFMINDTLSQSSAALLFYDRVANKVYLKNDANTSWGTGYAPGAAVTLENSQCKVYLAQTYFSVTSTQLIMNWRMELKAPFSAKNLNGYMYVLDGGGLSDGWERMAVYYEVKPEVVSIAPNSGSLPIDSPTFLASTYRDPNGYPDLRRCYLLVNDSLAQTNAVLVFYDRSTNKVYLKNDANTSWGTGYTLGTDIVLSNSQCELYVKDCSIAPNGTDFQVWWRLKLKPSMSSKNLCSWMYVTDSAGQFDGWKKVGTHFTPVAPTCVSITPSSGSPSPSTPMVFNTEYSDTNGHPDVYLCYLQISQTSSQANAILALYDSKQNKIFLRNDANTAWSAGHAPGANVTLSNSQCYLYVKNTTVTPSGSNNLLVDWNIELKPSQVGKLLCERMYCRDNELLNSGWKVKGYIRPKYLADVEMIRIPEGSFLMGNNGTSYSDDDEFPEHSVNLPEYWISKHEITRGQYRQFMKAGGYSESSYWSSEGWDWRVMVTRSQPAYWAEVQDWGTGNFTQTENHPVAGVTYYEAEAFCNWAGGRLPTEAEWEKAARGTGDPPNMWPWGGSWNVENSNNWLDHNVAGGGYQKYQTAPVGSYPAGASPYGCMDMAGNLYEWCKDWYMTYPGNPNPIDYTDEYRSIRGGGWYFGGESGSRGSARYYYLPYDSWYSLGFRMVK